MSSSRIKRGYQLYKDGLVEVTYEDEELITLEVRSRSRKDLVHEITFLDDCVMCGCEDFFNRHQRREEATFICQHIYASLFKLAELVGMKSQAVFILPGERVTPPGEGNIMELEGSDWEGK